MEKRKCRYKKSCYTAFDEQIDRIFNKLCEIQQMLEQDAPQKEIFETLENTRDLVAYLIKFKKI